MTTDPRRDPVAPQSADSQSVSLSSVADRRTLLRAAGIATMAGAGIALLSACSSAGADQPAGTHSSTAAGTPSAAASSPAASASGRSSAAVPSGPSVAESSVPQGGGVIMQNADYVVTQPAAGQFKAFSKICTHAGCPVSEVTDTIDCLCHGSKFSITDGSVVNGPATQPLPESPTAVRDGKVYVQA